MDAAQIITLVISGVGLLISIAAVWFSAQSATEARRAADAAREQADVMKKQWEAEQAEQERAQAVLVTASPALQYRGELVDATDIHADWSAFVVVVRNESNDPVTDLQVEQRTTLWLYDSSADEWRPEDDTRIYPSEEFPTALHPGRSIVLMYESPSKQWSAHTPWEYLEKTTIALTFKDARGRRWHRDWQGTLRRVD